MAAIVLYTPFAGYAPITQYYGGNHYGVDWGMPQGTPLYAAHAGQVVRSGWDTSGYGYMVGVRNTVMGVYTIYAHMPAGGPLVSVGQAVNAGQRIGRSGNTGNSTGPHLHFELRVGPNYTYPSSCRNPLPYLRPYQGQVTPPPPVDPPDPPVSTIAVGDIVHPVTGWRLRHGESLSGQHLLTTGRAQVAWQLRVVRIVGSRAVFEVSLDMGGLKK